MNFAINDHLIDEIIKDPIYDIRSDGTIWTKKPLSGIISKYKNYPWRRFDRKIKNGYWVISYYQKFIKVSRIVYRKFNGPLDPTKDINHKDGNKDNNTPLNLELLTNHKNLKHAVKNNLNVKGSKVGTSILKESQIPKIRALGIKGLTSYQIYYGNYGLNVVDRITIDKVLKWETWKHVISPICEDKQRF